MPTNLCGLLTLLAALAVGCAHTLIDGTQIPDTGENRTVYDLVRKVETALEARDTGTLLGMVSPRYFEDMGTPSDDDDYGYHEFKAFILPQSMSLAQEVQVSFEVHDIVVDGKHAHADVRYNSRARLQLPAGTIWDSHRDFNRIVFALEEGDWHIVSGL